MEAPVLLRDDCERERLISCCFREAKAKAVAEFERTYLSQLLGKAGGNISFAARISGKDRSALNRLVRKYGLTAEDFRGSLVSETPNARGAGGAGILDGGVALTASVSATAIAPAGTSASHWDELVPIASKA